jgi:hypothetical protein
MDRRAHSSRGVEGRINACRQRVRLNRVPQRKRIVHQDAGQHEESAASSKLQDALRMSSVAEILREAGSEIAWLKSEFEPEVDEQTAGRTGLSVKEEVGKA